MFATARLQSFVLVALAVSSLTAASPITRRSGTTVNGDNNYNSGSLQNGNNVDFAIGGAENISGVYNVGAGNSLNVDHSSIAGNSKKVTKVTKVTGHHKRHGSSSTTSTTTVNGSNDFNSGDLQNGNNVDFAIGGTENISGVYNVGAGNAMNVDHSSIAGNSKTKTVKVTKVTGHHKRHGSSSTASTTTVNGSNNFNSGDLQNGNNVDFAIGGADNISGVYNVGASNSMNVDHSSVAGNSKTKTVKVTKVSGHHKRHGSSSTTTTTTINGSNNGNSGSLQNGNNVDFAIGGADNISGVYNVGASNSLNVDHSSVAGNSKKVTKVTKVTGHHKRHGSSSTTSTTTVNGSNNFNSGDLQNGNNVNFEIGGAENISGVYNVGASNSLNIGHSSVSGNSNVKKVTVTKHH